MTAGVAAMVVSGVVAPAAHATTRAITQAATAASLYVAQGGSDTDLCTKARPCATITHALTKAAAGATINVSGTIDDHIHITRRVTITRWLGGPAGSRAIIDGAGTGMVVWITGNVSGVVLRNLTIENGGQGISNPGFGKTPVVKLVDSTVSGNNGVGGIYNGGVLTVLDSTIANNSDTGNGPGGGIYNVGRMAVIASTISGNRHAGSGGGIYAASGGQLSLAASIVANNPGGNCLADTGSTLVSAGYNLTNDRRTRSCHLNNLHDRVNKQPHLGSLANNGGPSRTMLPAAGGPADDVIPRTTRLDGVTVCPGRDQRGAARPAKNEGRCTIGAAEV